MKRGIELQDITGLIGALFHLSILLIGLGSIVYLLLFSPF